MYRSESSSILTCLIWSLISIIILTVLPCRAPYKISLTPGGTTNTAGAIEYVVNNSFTTSAGNRDDAIDVLITITDGESNNKTETIRVAQSIGVHNIRSYAIGVGNFTNSAELQAIASDPQHVFNVQNYAALFTLQRELSRAACIGMMLLFQL